MIHQGLQADGIHISISKLCRWFEVPRRSVYYRPVKAVPKVQEALLQPIKTMIEENPSFGYRTVRSVRISVCEANGDEPMMGSSDSILSDRPGEAVVIQDGELIHRFLGLY